MSEKFEKLIKIPQEPAAKILSQANFIMKTPVSTPVSAPTGEVLAELEAREAWGDILLLMAAALPPRERVWWACLAARDCVGPKSDKDPAPLRASEAWVFDPSEENRDKARISLDHAYVDDDTVNCAVAVLYSDGTLGPGDLAQYPAPAGAAEAAALNMNMVALNEFSDNFETHIHLLIDRALDIARGGNGQLTTSAGAVEGDT